MDAKECVELRIEVRASPETNEHEVRLLADGKSLVDRFSSGLIDLDPDDLLSVPSPLRSESSSRAVIIGRSSCDGLLNRCAQTGLRNPMDAIFYRALQMYFASGATMCKYSFLWYTGEIPQILLHSGTNIRKATTSSSLTMQSVPSRAATET